MSFIPLPKNTAGDAVLVEQKPGTSATVDDGGASLSVDDGGTPLSVLNIDPHGNYYDYNNLFPVADFYLEVDKGNVPGHSPIRFAGHSTEVSEVMSTIWDVPDTSVVKRAAATIMTISSDNADNTIAGTGAQIVTVTGLLGDYTQDTEDIEMDGLNPVSTTKEWIAINSLNVIQAGTNRTNFDKIYIGTGTVTGGVPDVVDNLISTESGIGDGSSQSSFYTVPAGHTFFVRTLIPSVESGKVPKIYNYIINTDNLIKTLGGYNVSEQLVTVVIDGAFGVPEKTLLDVRASLPTGKADVLLSVSGILINNAYLDKANA